MNTAKLFTNDKLNITEKIEGTRNFKEREIVSATMFQAQDLIYRTYRETTFRALLQI